MSMQYDRGKTKTPQILSGWKDIANYLGKGARTVQRYERLLGLPVRRPAGKPRGSVVATKAEIDAWVAASPIREGLKLLAPAYSSSTWSDLRTGAAEMRRLAQQMTDLRKELRVSVGLLRQTIREVRGELNAGEGRGGIESRLSQPRNALDLLGIDMTGRKAS